MSSLITVDCFVSVLSGWLLVAENREVHPPRIGSDRLAVAHIATLNLNIRRKHSSCISSALKAAYILKRDGVSGIEMKKGAFVCEHSCAYMCACVFVCIRV